MVVEAWLARAASERPRHTALRSAEGVRSYAELYACALAGREALGELGAGPGARVAIGLEPGLDFAVALHACLLLGAVAVPLDLRLARREREAIAGGCSLVLAEPLPAASSPEPPGERPVHDLAATALVIHTSGTTGAPRPVELTYGNLLWSALGSAVALGCEPADVWLCTLPLSHVGGLSILIRSAVYATAAEIHERFDTERVLAALAGEVTLVSLVATTLARLLDAGLRRPGRLRCALTGGGPVAPALLARALGAGVPVALTYGLSETCSQVTTTPLAAIGAGEASAGPPLFCSSVRLAEDGEILVRGPTVAPAAADAEGWLHTGDLGALAPGGGLLVTGRKADTIITGGENVAPAEVEAVLEAHPAVLEAAVVGRPHETWGEAVTAIVVLRAGHRLDQEALRRHCAASLAAFKVPKAFTASPEALPRTRSGKLLRRELA